MPATYEPIATTTLGSAASSITFSSIPGTYTDLRLILVTTKSSAGTFYPVLYVNNDNSVGNYSQTNLRANGTTVVSNRSTNAGSGWDFVYSGITDTQPGMAIADFFSYAGSTNKTVLMDASNDRNGSGNKDVYVGLWRSTAAITRIDISGSSFAAGTTATLYGILKA